MTWAIAALVASLARPFPEEPIHGPGAGAARSSSAAFTLNPSEPTDAVLIGFLIALAVGLTGIGGGSFTVPALVLVVGLPAGAAVGTAFVFAGVLRLIAAPFYMAGRHFHLRYLWLMLQGAVPGLLTGLIFCGRLSSGWKQPSGGDPAGDFAGHRRASLLLRAFKILGFAHKNSRWLPWLALPIGMESGFSSAGAGALGTVLLLNYSELTPPQVVGTDLLIWTGFGGDRLRRFTGNLVRSASQCWGSFSPVAFLAC